MEGGKVEGINFGFRIWDLEIKETEKRKSKSGKKLRFLRVSGWPRRSEALQRKAGFPIFHLRSAIWDMGSYLWGEMRCSITGVSVSA